MNPRRSIPGYIKTKKAKSNDNEKILKAARENSYIQRKPHKAIR